MNNFYIIKDTVSLTCNCTTMKSGKQPTTGSQYKSRPIPVPKEMNRIWCKWCEWSSMKSAPVTATKMSSGECYEWSHIKESARSSHRSSQSDKNQVFLSKRLSTVFLNNGTSTSNQKPSCELYEWCYHEFFCQKEQFSQEPIKQCQRKKELQKGRNQADKKFHIQGGGRSKFFLYMDTAVIMNISQREDVGIRVA